MKRTWKFWMAMTCAMTMIVASIPAMASPNREGYVLMFDSGEELVREPRRTTVLRSAAADSAEEEIPESEPAIVTEMEAAPEAEPEIVMVPAEQHAQLTQPETEAEIVTEPAEEPAPEAEPEAEAETVEEPAEQPAPEAEPEAESEIEMEPEAELVPAEEIPETEAEPEQAEEPEAEPEQTELVPEEEPETAKEPSESETEPEAEPEPEQEPIEEPVSGPEVPAEEPAPETEPVNPEAEPEGAETLQDVLHEGVLAEEAGLEEEFVAEEETKVWTSDEPVIVYANGTANIYAEPDENSEILSTVPDGTELPVVDLTGAWCVLADNAGYVSLAEIRETAAVQEAPAKEDASTETAENPETAGTEVPAAEPAPEDGEMTEPIEGENPEEQTEVENEPEDLEPEIEEPVMNEDPNKVVRILSNRKQVMDEGEMVFLSAELVGFDDCEEIIYIWKVDKGNGFEEVPDANGPVYSFPATPETLSWNWTLTVLSR